MVDLLGAKKQKQIQESIEQQIKILATNVEVLNQKLIQDPNAAITPGEAIIKKQTADSLQYLKRIEHLMSGMNNDITDSVTSQVQKVQGTFQNMVKELDRFPQEKVQLGENIETLQRVIEQLDKLDKTWLADFLTKVDVFNKNVNNLNTNLVSYHNEMVKTIHEKVSEVSSLVSNHIFKNIFWVFLSIGLIAMVFTFLGNFFANMLFS